MPTTIVPSTLRRAKYHAGRRRGEQARVAPRRDRMAVGQQDLRRDHRRQRRDRRVLQPALGPARQRPRSLDRKKNERVSTVIAAMPTIVARVQPSLVSAPARPASSRSISRHTATAVAIATRMLSFSGSATVAIGRGGRDDRRDQAQPRRHQRRGHADQREDAGEAEAPGDRHAVAEQRHRPASRRSTTPSRPAEVPAQYASSGRCRSRRPAGADSAATTIT